MSAPIVEITIAAPRSSVWRALREPAEIRRWHGWDYDGLDAEVEVEEIYISEAVASEEDGTIDTGGTAIALRDAAGGATALALAMSAPEDDERWEGMHDTIVEGWIA